MDPPSGGKRQFEEFVCYSPTMTQESDPQIKLDTPDSAIAVENPPPGVGSDITLAAEGRSKYDASEYAQEMGAGLTLPVDDYDYFSVMEQNCIPLKALLAGLDEKNKEHLEDGSNVSPGLNLPDETIADMTIGDLCKRFRVPCFHVTTRDKIKGKMVLCTLTDEKGKGTLAGNYSPGESSKRTYSLIPAMATRSGRVSELDNITVQVGNLDDHIGGTTVTVDKVSSESRDNYNLVQGGITTSAFALSPQGQQWSMYADNGADLESGASSSAFWEPPEAEAMVMFREPPAMILIAGAFALLSSKPETFQDPLVKVLFGVMILGLLSSFAWLLMGRKRRRSSVSCFLQWTTVLSVFVAFLLIMVHLIMH